MVAWASLAAPAQAQTLADLMAALEQGGGWVSIEIQGGRGNLQTLAVPTGGLLVEGYFQIWEHNSGRWSISATDLLSEAGRSSPLLQVQARPGQRVWFAHRTGMMARLRVDVEWSEPGDTTLWVWVGLGGDDAPEPGGSRRGRPGG